MNPITTFEDLQVWKVARELRKRLYAVARGLPELERYNLAPQIRRAAVSITANLAEGFGRFPFKENVQCCRISRGSTYESLDHVITCHDEGYLNDGELQELRRTIARFLQLLNGYIRSIGKASRDRSGSPLPIL